MMMASQDNSLLACFPFKVLMLGLILGLGLLPERCAGVKCYDCLACNVYTEIYTGNKSEFEEWPKKDCPSDTCFNSTSGGADNIQLGCLDQLPADCLRREIGLGCHTLTDENIDTFDECVKVKIDGPQAGAQSLNFKLCFCDTELCNEYAGSGAPAKVGLLRAVILVGIGSFCFKEKFFRV